MNSLGLAHSKFILSGEHFVVDGAPGIVLPAMCFSTQVSIRDKDTPGISVTFSNGDSSASRERENFIKNLIIQAGEILQVQPDNILVSVRSSVPMGQGAGSSSSLCQAVVQAMIKHYFADDFHPNYLDWFGIQLENTWHGPVSGIDNAAIAYRSILQFQKGKRPEMLRVPCPLFFVIGSTGPRTADPYAVFRDLRQNKPQQYAEYRRQMTDNTTTLSAAIERGELLTIGECMNASHRIFCEIGIVTSPMDAACQAAMQLGAFGSRMTGGGGGGFVIACVPIQCADSIVSQWRSMGLQSVRNLQFGLHTIE